MTSTPSFQFLVFLLFSLYTHPILHAHAASVPHHSVKEDASNGLGARITWRAPPQPWDQSLCRSSLHPRMHLTFTFGERLSPTRIHKALDDARTHNKVRIDAGLGDHPIPNASVNDYTVGWGRMTDHDGRWRKISRIKAIPYRKHPFSRIEFTIAQVAQALDLLERCGLAEGIHEEMWAYVFVEGKRVGYIWLEDFTRYSRDLME